MTARAALAALALLAPPALAQTPVLPAGAGPILSDIWSWEGVNGGRRDQIHTGVDIGGPSGQAVIAAADGKVLETAVDRCWGPTVVVDHGLARDGTRLIALYGHVDAMLVGAGAWVRRGEEIARLGDNHTTFYCIGGVRHLHLQLGQIYRREKDERHWGHTAFLIDSFQPVNPHLHWAEGPGRVTCFDPDATYPAGTLTWPLPCDPAR